MKQLHRDSIVILIPRYLAQTRDNYDRDTRSEDLFHGLLAQRTKGRRPFFQVLVIVVILEEAGTGEGKGTDENENKPVNEAYSKRTALFDPSSTHLSSNTGREASGTPSAITFAIVAT